NALHRMGMYSQLEGRRLYDLGLEESAIEWALASALPVVEEVERRPDVIVLLHCIPLLSGGDVTGCLVLLRDVTDVRRLDRLLLSKDAAIREVHHRVKNNLQTISSLLRLQSRRMPSGEASHALDEAERRVRSIAVVHEILSRDTTDEVDFNDILPSLVRMAEDLGSAERPVRITYRGEAGLLQASVATPLAVVITELLQNAAEHGVPSGDKPLRVDVDLERSDAELRVTVRDNGVGLPPTFSVEDAPTLGLSIVRGLVDTQMGGSIAMRSDGGAVVDVVIPVDQATDDLENL
ncbi:MAG: sensor histidine kinase, partial [Acidimicrobiales bacterium]